MERKRRETVMMKVGRRIGLFLAAALILSGCSNSAAEIGSSAAQTEAETSQAETERAGETAVTSQNASFTDEDLSNLLFQH